MVPTAPFRPSLLAKRADASSMIAVCDFVRICAGGIAPGGSRLTSGLFATLDTDGVGGGEYSTGRDVDAR